MIERRDFLKCSLLSVCTPAFTGLSRTASAIDSGFSNNRELADDYRVSVGYWYGSDHLQLLDAAPADTDTVNLSIGEVQLGNLAKDLSPSVRLISAEKLGAGDRRLIEQGVKLTIHGMIGHGNSCTATGLRMFDLLVKYKGQEVDSAWRAWSTELAPMPNVSPAVTAVVPVNQDGLELIAEMVCEDDSQTTTSTRVPIILSVTEEPFKPKLRRGVYFLPVMAPPAQAAPSWRQCRLSAEPFEEDKPEALRLALEFAEPPVATGASRKHLVFSVDYAGDA
jgi:hypothetical protein